MRCEDDHHCIKSYFYYIHSLSCKTLKISHNYPHCALYHQRKTSLSSSYQSPESFVPLKFNKTFSMGFYYNSTKMLMRKRYAIKKDPFKVWVVWLQRREIYHIRQEMLKYQSCLNIHISYHFQDVMTNSGQNKYIYIFSITLPKPRKKFIPLALVIKKKSNKIVRNKLTMFTKCS